MRVPHWLRDPPRMLRLVVTAALSVTVAALAVLAGVSYITSYKSAQAALHARDDSAARATARINDLTTEIRRLQTSAEANGGRIAELVAEVHALEEQVRAMGGNPVVTEPRTTSPPNPASPAPQSPSPAPEPSTTTTTARPAPTPTTTTTAPCARLPLVGCVGG